MPAIVEFGGGIPLSKYLKYVRVESLPTKSTYHIGETFNTTGLVIKAINAMGVDVVIENYETFPANGDVLTSNDNTVTVVCYDEAHNVHRIYFNITIVAPESLSIKTNPTKMNYIAGDALDLTGLVVTVNYTDGSTNDLSVDDESITTSESNGLVLKSNNDKITISYTEFGMTISTVLTINIKYITELEITTAPNKIVYYSGDTFNPAGMVVTATYSDGSTDAISDYDISPSGALSISHDHVTISVDNNNDNTVYVYQPIVVSEAVYTWADGTEEQLAAMFERVDAGEFSLANIWAVGEERKVSLGSPLNKEVTFVIEDLGEDGVSTTSGGTSYHVVVGLKNARGELDTFRNNNTNNGGYKYANVRDFIEGDFSTSVENASSGGFFNLIKSSTHKHYGAYDSGIQSMPSVKFVLHSEYEISGTNVVGGDESSVNKQFAYFVNSSASRVKYLEDSSNTSVNWALRTGARDNETQYAYVKSDATIAAGDANNQYAIIPFAII